MAEKPINFSTPEAQAILSSRKTQTRRVVKSQPNQRGRRGRIEKAGIKMKPKPAFPTSKPFNKTMPDPTASTAIKNTDRHPSEAHEQATVFAWAAWNTKRYPELELMHHIPNGGSRHKAEAANLKCQGVKPGVPDISLPVARRDCHGLYIEMKSKTGRITKAQASYINSVRKQGYMALICYGADEAIKVLEWYLGG